MENKTIKEEIVNEVDDFTKALQERDKKEQALRYNQGKLQWSLVDFDSLEGLVRVLEYGAAKYSIFEDINGKEVKGANIIHIPNFEDIYKVKISGKENWKKGLDLKSIQDSAMRHLIKMMSSEFVDEESKLLHAHHVICNMMFWVHFYKKA